MTPTLNPRLDVVFKLLFAAERNRPLLVALLNDTLRPASAIATVNIVNPEIEKDAPDDRGVALDISVAHNDGTRSNIEMRAQDRGSTEKACLIPLGPRVSRRCRAGRRLPGPTSLSRRVLP